MKSYTWNTFDVQYFHNIDLELCFNYSWDMPWHNFFVATWSCKIKCYLRSDRNAIHHFYRLNFIYTMMIEYSHMLNFCYNISFCVLLQNGVIAFFVNSLENIWVSQLHSNSAETHLLTTLKSYFMHD